ncbi:hypothetical protein ACOME3_005400 [Neoechinorhynchus agilis]
MKSEDLANTSHLSDSTFHDHKAKQMLRLSLRSAQHQALLQRLRVDSDELSKCFQSPTESLLTSQSAQEIETRIMELEKECKNHVKLFSDLKRERDYCLTILQSSSFTVQLQGLFSNVVRYVNELKRKQVEKEAELFRIHELISKIGQTIRETRMELVDLEVKVQLVLFSLLEL